MSAPILVQRSDVREFRRRYRWLVLVVLATFALLMFRLLQMQLIDGDVHRDRAHKNIVRSRYLATTRGVIRDAHGKVLAANRPSYNVYVVPSYLDLETDWPRLVQLLGVGEPEAKKLRQTVEETREKEAARRLLANQEGKEMPAARQILLVADVDRDVVARLETNEDDFYDARGYSVDVVPAPVRYYPHGELSAHLIGYMREIDAETLRRTRGQGYREGDRLGAVGVERRWESYLRGQRGWRTVLKGPSYRKITEELEEKYLQEPRRLEPVPGRDISLTLDVDLVKSMDRAMPYGFAGAVVAIDVRTGRILGALSKSSYDPNVASGGSGKEAVSEMFRRLYKDPLKPMLDKTISAAYPPGSTFKPFSALAGLDANVLNARTEADCRGGLEYGRRYFRCTGVHRQVDLHQALVQSCNTYFYSLGEHIHIDRLARMGMEFGFGTKTGIGINPEAPGRMPTRAWYAQRYKGFRGGFTLLTSIGQGASTVTVLQLALAYAALANGGTLYQPQVVRSIETSDGTVVQEFPPRVRRLVEIESQRLSALRFALTDVVNDRKGTAYGARIEGVDLAGKTGTAEVSRITRKEDHAWFAGYAPADAPEIAIVVLVEHGGGGGKTAVPVAMRVIRDWQELKQKRLTARAAATVPAATRGTF